MPLSAGFATALFPLLVLGQLACTASWARQCKVGHIKCGLQDLCVSPQFQCDGFPDCTIDRQDEETCVTCKPGAFLCDGHRCVAERFRCDAHPHCLDGQDELGCRARHFSRLRPLDCNKTLNKNVKCNGILDCPDGTAFFEDEVLCDECSPGSFKCRSGEYFLGFCLRDVMLCDGNQDCPDGADEEGCPGGGATSAAGRAALLLSGALIAGRGIATLLSKCNAFTLQR